MQISLEAMITYVPEDIHRRLKSSQLGRHFIVNLMLLFVRLTVPRRCCRDRQDTFCRLLILRADRGAAFHFISFDICEGHWLLLAANGDVIICSPYCTTSSLS